MLAIEADHLEIATVDPHSDLYSALVCFFSEVHSQKETHDEHVLQRGERSSSSTHASELKLTCDFRNAESGKC